MLVISSVHGAVAVHAQAWIGEYVGRLYAQEALRRCMMGAAPSLKEVDEARVPAVAAMERAGIVNEPESFVRAGQGATARGLWRKSSGEVVLVDFKRKAGVWKLRTLRVLPPGEATPVVTQYCQTPGDVEAYRARIAAIEQARAEKRAAKARAKALRAASPDG